MARPRGVEINGKMVQKLRRAKGWTQGILAAKIYFSSPNGLGRIEQKSRVSVAMKTVESLASALGLEYEAALKMLQEGLEMPENLDENVEPYSEEKVPEIPLFDLAVAAGKWVDVDEFAEVCDPRQIDHGLFRIRIRGDSMKPKFKEGDIVEFRCLREGRDSLEIGAFYYVQRDGQGTFKALAKIEEDRIVLRALNKKKYPDPLPVERRSIVRMARAMAIVKQV